MKTVKGIEYLEPVVIILQDTGIGHTEIAGRTAYNSFDKSENEIVKEIGNGKLNPGYVSDLEDIESSKLLKQLAWVHHHHSVLEHTSITYLLKDVGRGVLQELVRHRIASYTVKSSRYTMSSVINAYIASLIDDDPKGWFINKMHKLNILITTHKAYNYLEYGAIYDKLKLQYAILGKEEFIKISVSKSSSEYLNDSTYITDELFDLLENGKAKRNIGDPFKHIVTDNWKTDIVMTVNLRSLKNFFELRLSNSAWFQIQWLAQQMVKSTPNKYLKLILKEDRIKKFKS